MKLHISALIAVASAASAMGGCAVDTTQCYTDHDPRILGNANVAAAGTPITREYCAQLCDDRNSTLAGVENGEECYCGDKFNMKPTSSTGCTVACNGRQNETCGGYWALEVFDVKCSGAPVPVPVPPPELVNPCLDPTSGQADLPWCDHTLAIEARVEDMISRMSVAEKINAMQTNTQPIPSLSLPAYNWWSEASSGVSTDRNQKTTKFAFPITTGMSFNRTLWQLTGRQIAMEARALMNAGEAFSTFWAPVINLAREPRWGRNIETPGEDPFVSGEYANYFVQGFQQAPEDPYHILASACCKHYAANSMDGTTEKDGEHHDRNHYSADISMRDLVDSYMLPFQACVEKGRVSSLMCSYNAINGVPSCANDWLLQTVARENWNFDGYITSDCDADADVYRSHHFTQTPEEAVRDVLRAGTDIDCGNFVTSNAQSALDKKVITEKDLDDRLKMQFKVRMRLSHFDPVGPLDKIQQKNTVCSDYAIALSQDGVTQSSALLKNIKRTLPLTKGAAQHIAVIGPTAMLSKSDSSYYGPSRVCGGNFWTLVDAVKSDTTATVTYTAGVPSVLSNDTSGIAAAVTMAEDADEVILAVGTDLTWAAEGHDAKTITFTDAQQQLIDQVTAAAKKPVIVVLMTATPLDLTSVLANKNVGALLHVGQPSVTVMGVAPLLYGERSPAGRMVQTVYPKKYADEISIFDFGMRPGPSPFARPDCTNKNSSSCPRGTNPGRTYRFYTGKPVVPFGFGLSYTTFSYSNMEADVGASSPLVLDLSPLRQALNETRAQGHTFIPVSLAEDLRTKAGWTVEPTNSEHVLASKFQVNVTNTGSVDSDDVVLGFLTPPGAGQNGVALKTLFGFQRVHVPAGQTVSVFLYPALTDFARADAHGVLRAIPGDYSLAFGVEETLAAGGGFIKVGTVRAV
jgi:pre-mRNA-splicing factor SYF2/beta-D-xylosidase 4